MDGKASPLLPIPCLYGSFINNHMYPQSQGQTGHLAFQAIVRWAEPFLAEWVCLTRFLLLHKIIIIWLIMWASGKNGPVWRPQGKKWAVVLEMPGTIFGQSLPLATTVIRGVGEGILRTNRYMSNRV